MHIRTPNRMLSVLALTLASSAAVSAAGTPAYRLTERIAGPDGRWDLVDVDGRSGRIYVARGDNVLVIDPADSTGARATRSFGALKRGHGALPLARSKRLLVTSGGDDSARLFDLATEQEVARITVGKNPDAMAFDPASGLAAVMNAGDGTVSVVDPAGAKVVRTIALSSGLELGVVVGGILLVNNEDKSEIERAVIASGKVLAPFALPGCEGPTGLAYEPASRLLVSACANGKAAVVDATSGREVALLPIGRGPDGAVADPKRHRVLVPCGRDGVVDVILVSRGRAVRGGEIATAPSARTAAIGPDGALYLPSATMIPPLATAGPDARPTMAPGSFRLLVVRPD